VSGKRPIGIPDGAIGSIGAYIFDYIERVQHLRNPGQVLDEMARQISAFGIQYFAIGHHADTGNAFKQALSIDRAYQPWTKHFFSRGYGDNNPSMRGLLIGNGPLYWSEMAKLPKFGNFLSLSVNDAKEFGLTDGLHIPIVCPHRDTAFATLSGRDVDTSPAARISLHAIMLFTYSRLVRLHALPQPATAKLTSREADCLSWVAQGKTDAEIGEILSISENTAHWHIEQAKRKFGVATRIQAVVEALQKGCIAP
jgi:DNA-binding CsgD family transcriptional regulator